MSKPRGPYRVDPLGYKKKAMQQALEALQESIDVPCYGGHPKQEAAAAALREALAEQSAQPEPCCGKYADCQKACTPRGRWLAQQEFVSPGGGYVPAIPAKNAVLAEQPAQPQQEPVEGDWIGVKARWGKRFVEMPNPLLGPDYIARFYFDPPAQRTWVGLTDEDLYKVFPAIATYTEANKGLYRSIARVIEDALRSKNT